MTEGFPFLFKLRLVVCLDSSLSVGVFDIPFVHHEETFNVSEFHSRSKIDLP